MSSVIIFKKAKANSETNKDSSKTKDFATIKTKMKL